MAPYSRPQLSNMNNSVLAEVLASPLSDLPQVVVAVLEVCDRRDASVADVAARIEGAPGIAVRLLRFANSAELSRTTGPSTILDATALAGLDLCRAIALGEVMSASPRYDAIALTVRSRCLFTAAAARALTRDEGRRAADHALLAGLLALVGELLVAQCRPDLMSTLLEQRHPFDPDLERRVLGISGPAITAQLLRQWRVPREIVEAVESRDETLRIRSPLKHIVQQSVMLAELLGASRTPTDDDLDRLGVSIPKYERLLEDLADLAPNLAPFTGEAPSRLVRMVSTTRASIILRAITVESTAGRQSAAPMPADAATGLPLRSTVQRYANALDEFVERSRAENADTPSVGALVFRLSRIDEIVEIHGRAAGIAATAVLADLLSANVRLNEFLGHLSATDFIIIAPATSPTELAGAQNRFEQLLTNAKFEWDGLSIELGVGVRAALDRLSETVNSVGALED